MITDSFDVAIIGGGILGCFCVRNIRRFNLSVVLIEKNSDVCLEISKANTAVIYPGYDNRPGSLKAKMCVEANRNFPKLCSELSVAYSMCGSLMTANGEGGDKILKKKLSHGTENGVEGLKIVSGKEAKEIEKELTGDISSALYAETTGTVNPWELGIAAYENARENGAEVLFNEEAMSFENGCVKLKSGREIKCAMLIDASGENAGKLTGSDYYLNLDAADYVVIDRHAKHMPHKIIFHQGEIKCRGITAVPTVEGTLLLGPTHRKITEKTATVSSEIDEVVKEAKEILPDLEMNVIRTFAAVRPNVESKTGADIHDFVIEEKNSSISLIGIKTPGITCAEEIGKYVAEKCAKKLNADINPKFNPFRRKRVKLSELTDIQKNELIHKNPDYGKIVCLCENISLGEIRDAVLSGAGTVESVKHRCGATMGRCQGSRCSQKIQAVLENVKNGEI